jgi:UDP-N-acetylmuramoyl-tripeptide--D-alanyl-D-alanine ligase
MLTLADAFEALTHSRPETAELVITEAVIDSRQAIPGGMFVALPGERADGHDFVAEAFRRGASFALIEHEVPGNYAVLDFRKNKIPVMVEPVILPLCILVDNSLMALQRIAAFWRKKLNIRVIGITGSVGKSTTKEVVTEVLSQRYHTLKNPGNLNNEIGLPLTLLKLGAGHERAVLEMGFYVPGEIKFLCDIALPSVGVITNIGTVHAERAGSQEAIARGKSELVRSLPAAPEGTAVLNHDDPWVRWMADKTQAQIFYYGLDPKADLWADEVESEGLEGIRFRLHYKDEVLHTHAPMIGQHSVHTALRATAVGLIEGLTWQEIFDGLQRGHTQLRMVAVRTESGAMLLDDTYNASPESMLAALNLLDEMEGRKIAVLGDMLELGQYEKQGHELVGVRAARVADVLVTLGPRAHTIAAAANKAGLKKDRIFEYEEIEPVTEWLRTHLSSHDSVLLKGSHGLRMDRITAALEVQE